LAIGPIPLIQSLGGVVPASAGSDGAKLKVRLPSDVKAFNVESELKTLDKLSAFRTFVVERSWFVDCNNLKYMQFFRIVRRELQLGLRRPRFFEFQNRRPSQEASGVKNVKNSAQIKP